MISFRNHERFQSVESRTLVGVKEIVQGLYSSGEQQRSDHIYSPWIGVEPSNGSLAPLKVPMYKSEDRYVSITWLRA